MADDQDDEPIEGISFFEPRGYKRTTKRITDGNQLCTDLVEMVQERCDIEQKYANYLKNWSKKWGNSIEKGPEYGSMESAWKAVLSAADREADVHMRVRENLINNMQNEVRRWQKENFHKGMMSLHLKEKKEVDEEFKKAQKPWIKKLQLVDKYKAEYHALCQKEQSAQLRGSNFRNDPSISEDQRAKTADEIARLGSQRLSAKGSYDDALKDLNSYNPRYMEDMKEVYTKCQEMENRRLDFFKERLLAMHHNLDLSNDITLKQISADYLCAVEAANAKSDLKWWDIQRGIDMPMSWPQFEEWSPGMKDIVKPAGFMRPKGDNTQITGGTFRKKPEETNLGVTSARASTLQVRGQTNGVNGDPALRPIATSRESINRHSNSRESLNAYNPFGSGKVLEFGSDGEKSDGDIEASSSTRREAPRTPVTSRDVQRAVSFEANPFNEDWSEAADGADDRTKPGVKVRALYAYAGEDTDELSFKEGDVFDKIEERDEQGWCKGRKGSLIGLFPADYVELV